MQRGVSNMAKFDDLSRLLNSFVGSGLPGCACAVAKDGEILWEGYFGYADMERKIPMNEGSVFRLASMTKVIVCTAALILYERGKFLLSDPVYEYIPEYKETYVYVKDNNGDLKIEKAKNPVLVKHAFTMTVGLPYPFRESPTAIEMRKVREELTKKYGKYDIVTEAKAMASVPQEFEPGTRWLYGYGHDIVAALIQVISGKKVSEFLKEEIFEPLGMNDTAYRYFGDIEERMVACYRKKEDGTFERTKGLLDEYHERDAVYESGGGGLFSTVRDYIKFSQMLANGGVYKGKRIIGRKTIDLMRTNQLNSTQLLDFNKNNIYLSGYGYGLGVRTLMSINESNFNSSIGEFGWTGALGTYVSIDPSEGFSLVYMHQMIPNMEEYYHLRVRSVAYGCL